MAPSRKRKAPPTSLNAGRPTQITKTASNNSTLSSLRSRQLIRSHHILNKVLAQATASRNTKLVTEVEAQLQSQGGVARYQEASKAGQSVQRGGDSSLILVEWLRPLTTDNQGVGGPQLRMLEVGALSTNNACSKCGLFDVTRIDLHAQNRGITRQDFMERPLPTTPAEWFDCVSLSLVLNFVPDPRSRGEMLKRVPLFLRQISPEEERRKSVLSNTFPSMFLVLPAPCVMNSRYLNEGHLASILQSLGFQRKFQKLTAKVVYQLWVFRGSNDDSVCFPKVEVNAGKSRNNFAVVLE